MGFIRIAKNSALSSAFTLAEVLITLTIIGIVAAITIPTLMQNRAQDNFNKLKTQFEAKLVESTRQMNLQDGVAPYSDTKSFTDKFKKYMKFVKICEGDNLQNCFGDYKITQGEEEFEVKDLNKSSTLGKKDYDTKNTGLIILDGMFLVMSYNPVCEPIEPYTYSETSNTTGCLSYILDVNGKKGPNIVGKDIFTPGVILAKGVATGEIPCRNPDEAWKGNCTSPVIKFALLDATTTEYLGTNSGGPKDRTYLAANASGTCMTYGLAYKTCSDMGMRLATWNELQLLHQAAAAGKIPGFSNGNYWAHGSLVGTDAQNCNMGPWGGNCGSSAASMIDGQYVRCVKP